MPDQSVTCPDCSTEFVVTEGEAQFLRDKFGETFQLPKRCRDCRRIKKQQRAQRDNPSFSNTMDFASAPVQPPSPPAVEERKSRGRRRRADRREY